MLKDISSIKLQGANFLSATTLPILDSSDKKYAKVALLYGRNGAGKSTIAKAFRKIKGEAVDTVVTTDIMDKSNKVIALSESEKSRIFVFDEDFVTTNVRIEESGLGNIVMLGAQVDLTAQIEQVEIALKKSEDLVKTANDIFKKYRDDNNPKSPGFYIKKIRSTLQHDEGWAGRCRKIKDSRRNANVTDETYKQLIQKTPEKSRDKLIIEFENKMKELEAAKNGVSQIGVIVPSIPDRYKHYSITMANELIKKKVEKPELSMREKYLFSLITNGEKDELQTRIDNLKRPETTFCPYCLQDLTLEYKNNLIELIQKILTDELEQHQIQLQALEYNELILDITPFSSLPSYQTCVDLILIINNILSANNTLLQRKIKDPYSPILDEELTEIIEDIKLLDEALKKLEEERKTHNNNAIKTTPIEKALKFINDQIAYYDIIDNVKHLKIQQNEMDAAKKTYESAIADKNRQQQMLENLNGRRKRTDIAVDMINNGLKYIFFADNRITIEQKGDFYVLLSNGHYVRPKNVSVGERNIIGLCYFFTSIMTNRNKDLAYNDEYFIIIDDPVSSYDFENKIGILSFLKYKLSQFLNGNANSRVIIMTHDILTLFDLEKICQENAKNWKNIFSGQAMNYHLWELKNGSLNRFEYKSRQEYTELIKLIYDYGCGNAEEYDIVIGNIMRQALEAFATFEYKKGIEEISIDESVLTGMCDEHKSYFKNLMYRIVLNNGSHRKEQTLSLQMDFFSVISKSEKQRTAKEIICFIYLLNKNHILSHLAHIGEVRSILDQWCEEIKYRSVII